MIPNIKMRAVIYKLLLSLFIILCGTNVSAQDFGSLGLPALTSSLDANGDSTYSLSLQILVLMTVLTVIPSILLGMTAFTRIIIVLSILRQAARGNERPN